MTSPLRTIDLSPEERGSLCLVCEELPAQFRDLDLGPVCLDCGIECLRAMRALKVFGGLLSA